ncbi:MAG: EamA family transporter [Rhizobiales bacterium]|nr:EamA family transporter [Hyphomicrobiales bacterium]
MSLTVFAVVLVAATMHAGWNALVKSDLDRFLSINLISLSAGLLALIVLPFVKIPIAAAWPYLIVSATFNTGYKLFLIQAYRAGDLGQVYPIARGAAPLLTALVMAFGFGEVLTPIAMGGVLVLILGVFLMSARGGHGLDEFDSKTIWFSLGTSVFIASYTVTDGLGARTNGDAVSYATWLFVVNEVMMLPILLAVRGGGALRTLLPYWKRGLAGGAMTFGAYGLVIWATTQAPIALVAALRESSVLIATAISIFLLREPITRWRLISAILIITGLGMTRVG